MVAQQKHRMIDGNEAAASVAYRLSEIAAIYPITPSSPMGESVDEWVGQGKVNLWGEPLRVVEMQSEGGAAGAIHGAATAGALATTFTASQGLLLMIPNMYKIAGELSPFVMHVAARSLASHALSIFGDHSDVMSCRHTGFAMLAALNVQEAHDFAAVSHAASLRSRIPFMHFFDGFRTSHELNKVAMLEDDDLRAIVDDNAVTEHRLRGLSPDRPSVRGTAHNPDTFFQGREACNPFYDATPGIVQDCMDELAKRTGRSYKLFDYFGAPDAERVIVLMGSGAETAIETVNALVASGEKVGVVVVRLYRPFDGKALLGSLPGTTRAIAVLDRTKEPGSVGEPLLQDVHTVLRDAEQDGASPLAIAPRIIGGRYGLSGKEFTPGRVKAIYEELAKPDSKVRFTIGINDDVTHLSIPFDDAWEIETDDTRRAIFYGLGADGTVGANKNSIKIIGESTDMFAQGYFVYDSKKSGSTTTSHLRFSPEPVKAPYLIRSAQFIGVHQFNFLEQIDVFKSAMEGGTVLLNSPYGPDEVWDQMPREAQEAVLAKNLKLYVIDAAPVAEAAGMGRRINTIMQACFFGLSGVLPREEAIAEIKKAIEKTYGKKGQQVVEQNIKAVDAALDHLHEVKIPGKVTATATRREVVPDDAPDFVKRLTSIMMAGHGESLPVSAFPPDGSWPTATTRWEKRAIAPTIPIWEPELCIQCNKCAFVCPHATIRPKVYEESDLKGAPDGFRSVAYKAKDFRGSQYTIQVAPADCTGCGLCVEVCPAKDKASPKRKAINMAPMREYLEAENENWDFFLDLPQIDRERVTKFDVKSSQLHLPLMEFSGACSGCGETAYIKLLTQLIGDHLLIANATGCSSIYGGNLPTTPYCQDAEGRGPAWSNSLFEDNAEFGLGIHLAANFRTEYAQALVRGMAGQLSGTLVEGLLGPQEKSDEARRIQRERVTELRRLIQKDTSPQARALSAVADDLVRKSTWIVGGDGWSFDIGYGGLDHVIASGHDINILVLDTEVYSNTGGQASKATPIGAAAKFAARGKSMDKKDLGLMAMNYGHVYVASVAMGAKDAQTVDAFKEAEAYEGPSLIIAYSHCIAHGYDLKFGLAQQSRAVQSGVWPLYRYNPERALVGESPLTIDAPGNKIPVADYMRNETRFRMVERIDRAAFKRYGKLAQENAERRVALYQHLADMRLPAINGTTNGSTNPSDEGAVAAPVGATEK